MSNIISHHQQPNLGQRITLFEFDLRLYDQGHLYLVTGDEGDTVHPVTFDSQLYSPWAIKSSGWEMKSAGTIPRPKLSLANTSNILTALVEGNSDLEGCTVKRIITYDRYLDDGQEPDPMQTKPIDEYIINRKLSSVSGESITFELVSPMDQEGTMLPRRQANRDYCPLVYRIFNSGTGQFDHEEDIVTCPYDENTNGGLMYDSNDQQVTNGADDVCGKRLGSCKIRHGNLPLPFGAFPGLSRVKAQ